MIRGGDSYDNKDLEIDAKTQAWDNLEQSHKNTLDSLNAVNSLYVELKRRAEQLLAETPDNENVKKVVGLLNYRLKHSVGLDKASVDSEQTITTSANALANLLIRLIVLKSLAHHNRHLNFYKNLLGFHPISKKAYFQLLIALKFLT